PPSVQHDRRRLGRERTRKGVGSPLKKKRCSPGRFPISVLIGNRGDQPVRMNGDGVQIRPGRKRSRSKVVMVTGASAGVGRAIARRFGAEGAHVGLIARGREALEGAKQDVEALGGQALVLPADVADADLVERAAEELEQQFGPIDIWVNNATVTVFSPVKDM